MSIPVSNALLSALSDRITREMGICFLSSHYDDMIKGISEASVELGFSDPVDCMKWLVNAPLQKEKIGILASYLTIGETYFFREKASFDALEHQIIPDLIRDRYGNNRRLIIWSAACCTGEEPYSIAILLNRLLPDRHLWDLKILATDLNPHFLDKAQRAVYGEWSFRDVPESIKAAYFTKVADNQYELVNEIKQMVQYETFNLVEDAYPHGVLLDQKVDIVFCRNVLMYFDKQNQRQVALKLRSVLSEDGWLVPGLTEISDIFTSAFIPVSFPGALLYRKKAPHFPTVNLSGKKQSSDNGANLFTTNLWVQPPVKPTIQIKPVVAAGLKIDQRSTVEKPPLSSVEEAKQMIDNRRYDEAVLLLKKEYDTSDPSTEALVLLAKACANQGRLSESEKYVQKALSKDRLNVHAHYFHATIQQEQGELDGALKALQRALYLDPDFILAHLSMAQIASKKGNLKLAEKHFQNALNLLKRLAPDVIISETDGLTARNMINLIEKTAQLSDS